MYIQMMRENWQVKQNQECWTGDTNIFVVHLSL